MSRNKELIYIDGQQQTAVREREESKRCSQANGNSPLLLLHLASERKGLGQKTHFFAESQQIGWLGTLLDHIFSLSLLQTRIRIIAIAELSFEMWSNSKKQSYFMAYNKMHLKMLA
jgi:hypothetical protein